MVPAEAVTGPLPAAVGRGHLLACGWSSLSVYTPVSCVKISLLTRTLLLRVKAHPNDFLFNSTLFQDPVSK